MMPRITTFELLLAACLLALVLAGYIGAHP